MSMSMKPFKKEAFKKEVDYFSKLLNLQKLHWISEAKMKSNFLVKPQTWDLLTNSESLNLITDINLLKA